MSDNGLIIGKFYPPHAGHHFLIDTALSECDNVYVLVNVNDVEESSLPGMIRVNMIQSAHPEAFAQGRLHVYHVVNNLPVDYSSREADKAHAKFFYKTLRKIISEDPMEPFPNVLYSSEDYGNRLVDDFNELGGHFKHRMVDQKRIAKPISASKVRADVVGQWDFLAESTRASMTKRVVVCGAESSGTTTLTKALAERFQTVWVPEWGRLYSEAVGNHHKWTSADFVTIMQEQNILEDTLAHKAGPVMFCDTDNLATRMFHELYLGTEGPDTRLYHEVERYTLRSLYIITDDVGVDFEDDGYRLYPHQRTWATNWLKKALTNLSLPYIVVTGDHHERMDQATKAIEPLIKWDFATPVEYA